MGIYPKWSSPATPHSSPWLLSPFPIPWHCHAQCPPASDQWNTTLEPSQLALQMSVNVPEWCNDDSYGDLASILRQWKTSLSMQSWRHHSSWYCHNEISINPIIYSFWHYTHTGTSQSCSWAYTPLLWNSACSKERTPRSHAVYNDKCLTICYKSWSACSIHC